jgi:tryptophan synthase alpha chain
MITIQETFKKLQQEKGKAFIPFITAGDPHIEVTPLIVETLSKAGADIIELGVPFSDPIADGPTNQLAAERSLAAGTDLSKVLESVKIIRDKGITTPIVLFTYLNPIMAMGFEKFSQKAKEVGVQGLLIVDLPPESAIQHLGIKKIFDVYGLETIFLASPTTEKERLPFIDDASRGFVYYVSRTGITGARNTYSGSLLEKIKEIKASINKQF